MSINIDTFESDYDAFPVRLPKYHHSKGELNFFPEIICGGKFLKADWLKLHATAKPDWLKAVNIIYFHCLFWFHIKTNFIGFWTLIPFVI